MTVTLIYIKTPYHTYNASLLYVCSMRTGGAMSSHLDISSDLASTLYGLTNTFATTGGILGVNLSVRPRVSACVALCFDKYATARVSWPFFPYVPCIQAQLLDRGFDWSTVFCSVAFCYVLAAAFFLYFGDAQKKFS